ncbi:Arginine permease [Wickerhamomyces ciferrii]|uniref:Arginine permease n=1 Tax=Wickerhamomyces ciferrii (strain ATCC 14091 / BCRC 22168 / CBS 111 / JCM 3599 / NBRC 0793 / NRRL Y-1031 F-60-10) TaxID=1206466 RepID=K0KR68_WICCF|nr:Arginine permease [Wickerhamomyces ciferrii]CCH43788.1 Arginine permease [Wickerhamomyces ciferrii]
MSFELKDLENGSSSKDQTSHDMKNDVKLTNISDDHEELNLSESEGAVKETQVKRSLKPRHVTMIALGGTIGTGLFIGISTPISQAGPVNSLIAYLFMATIAYSVTQSLGEMATFIPVTSSFTVFTQRFLSPALGVANGYMYCFTWCITFALELSIVGQIIQYWTDAVPLAAWIAIFWVILVSSNMFPVKFYGEVEFWVASVKIMAIVGFIIYSFIMVVGGGKHGPIGFRYWRNPGAWGPGYLFPGTAKGKFLGWVSSLVNAAFTYQGTELTGISAGESKNPRRTVPKAINKVFFRILFFYVLSLFFVGLLVPYNDPKFTSTDSYVSSSPFIIAIQNSGTPILPDIFNAVVLLTIISAGNSNVYIGSRILYSLAQNGLAPKWFKITSKHGVPYVSVLMISAFGFLGFMAISSGASTVFDWLLNITAIAGLFAWLFISLSHIRFMHTLAKRGISRDELPYKAHFMPWAAYYAAFFVIVIIFINGFPAFIGGFHVEDFFTAYVSVILFVALWMFFQFIFFRGPLLLKTEDVDIDTDRREIDAIVWEDEPPKNLWEKFWAYVA